jgi:hypothetical protein
VLGRAYPLQYDSSQMISHRDSFTQKHPTHHPLRSPAINPSFIAVSAVLYSNKCHNSHQLSSIEFSSFEVERMMICEPVPTTILPNDELCPSNMSLHLGFLISCLSQRDGIPYKQFARFDTRNPHRLHDHGDIASHLHHSSHKVSLSYNRTSFELILYKISPYFLFLP